MDDRRRKSKTFRHNKFSKPRPAAHRPEVHWPEEIVCEKVNSDIAAVEMREAFKDFVSTEKFSGASEVILKYVGKCLLASNQTESAALIEQEDFEDDVVFSQDVIIVLKRLISNLACSNIYVRSGCYATLMNLMQLHPEVVSYVTSFTDDFYAQEQPQRDVADYMVGHLLACGALIKSGYIFQNKKFAKSILKKIIFLRETCPQADPIAGQFLVDIVKNENSVLLPVVWEEVKDLLVMPIKILSPSLVWLRYVLARDEFICNLPGVPRDFREETFDVSAYILLAQLLKKLHVLNKVNIDAMVQDIFLSMALYNKENDGSENIMMFLSKGFLPCITDTTKLSPSKVTFGINIAMMALPYLTTKEQIEQCLCPEVIERVIAGSAMTSAAVRTSINEFARVVLRQIVLHKDNESDTQIATLKPLIVVPGSVRFDSITKTKVLEQANQHLNASTVKQLSKILAGVIEQSYSPEGITFEQCPSSEEYRLAVIWFSVLISNPVMFDSANTLWKANQSAVLLKNTFFRKHSHKMLRDLKGAYQRSLEQLNKKLEDQVTAVDQLVMEGDKYLLDLEKDCLLDEETKTCWRKVSHRMQKMKKLGKLPQKELMVFRLLYGQMNLHLLFDNENAMELISELDQCYKRAFKSKSYRQEMDDNDIMWADVVVDLLLTLLSKSNHYWRKIVVAVFRNLCPIITPSSLSLLADTINPEKQAEMFESDDESDVNEEETESEGNDMEDDDDDDEETDEEIESETESENDETDEDADSVKDSKGLSKKEITEMEMLKLKGEMLKLQNVTDVDVDMDSVPQSELEDLDKRLGPLLKQFAALKRSKKKWTKTKLAKDEVSLMHFRIRVCDLFDALVNNAASPSHLMKIIQPLLLAVNQTFREKFQEPLRDRLSSIIKELGKVRKFGDLSDCSTYIEEIIAEMNSLFGLCEKLCPEISNDISRCWTFLVRTGLLLLKKEGKDADVIYEAFTKHLESYLFHKDWKLVDIAFTGPLMLESSSLGIVLKMLIDHSFYAPKKGFMVNRAFEMIKLIFLNEKSMKKIPQSDLIDLQEKIRNNILQRLSAIKEPNDIKTSDILLIIDFLKTLKTFHKQHNELESSFKWNEIIEVFQSFCIRVSLDGHESLKKALDAFGVSLKVKLLRDEPEIVKSNEKKSKKNKKGKKRNINEISENGNEKTHADKSTEPPKIKKKKSQTQKKKRTIFFSAPAPELNFRFSHMECEIEDD